MLVAGVDDAGRGAVIGPLVIAGVLMKEEDLPGLKRLGVRDSKMLSPKRREVLAIEVRRVAVNFSVVSLSPREIDAVVESGRKLRKLNYLEAQAMARVIESLRPDIVYVDASDVLEERFKQHILECTSFKVNIVSEHKADRNHAVVSAASIIAKVERDGAIAELAKTLGDFGSGYPSDPKTMNFLRKCCEKLEKYPDFVRKSWKPAKRVRDEKGSEQTRLNQRLR
jgi:ribonuclease HII